MYALRKLNDFEDVIEAFVDPAAGLEAAQQVLEALKQHLAPPPSRGYVPASGGGLPPQMQLTSEGEEEEVGEQRVARQAKRL